MRWRNNYGKDTYWVSNYPRYELLVYNKDIPLPIHPIEEGYQKGVNPRWETTFVMTHMSNHQKPMNPFAIEYVERFRLDERPAQLTLKTSNDIEYLAAWIKGERVGQRLDSFFRIPADTDAVSKQIQYPLPFVWPNDERIR